MELVVALAISLILSTAMYLAFKYSAKFFVQNKKISDLVEYARTTEIQLSYYFNRWGIGVPEDSVDKTDCSYIFSTDLGSTDFPASRYCITVSGGVCDEIEFYGNVNGFAMVLNQQDPNHFYAYACRMDNRATSYYYIWRNNSVLALTTGDRLRLRVNERGCGLNGNIRNATISKQIEDINGNVINLQTGDVIMRVPKVIRIYCSSYHGKNYLYVSEREGNKRPISYPLAPVDSMSANLVPEGCQPNEGSCRGVILDITFSKNGDTLRKVLLFTR